MTISQVSFGSHEPVLDVKDLIVKYIGDTRSTTAVVSFFIARIARKALASRLPDGD